MEPVRRSRGHPGPQQPFLPDCGVYSSLFSPHPNITAAFWQGATATQKSRLRPPGTGRGGSVELVSGHLLNAYYVGALGTSAYREGPASKRGEADTRKRPGSLRW